MNENFARVWLEIDLSTIKDNYRKIREAVSPLGVMPILKADAYGLGVGPIAAALTEVGATRFGVAELNEALTLFKQGCRSQIIGSVLPEEIVPALKAGVILPITDYGIAQEISRVAIKMKKKAECHVLIDTGMGRLGLVADKAVAEVEKIHRLKGIDLSGIYSHFPVAYLSGSEFTTRQVYSLVGIMDQLKAKGILFRERHIANSDGINNFPISHMSPFTMVRTGINLYGIFDLIGEHKLRLKPVFTLKTRLTAIRDLPAGMTIGYGQTYRLAKATRVGIISAGYADGMPLALSNRGHVLLRGVPCPIIGRISMDYTAISLESMPDCERGDEVICLGGEGPTAIGAEDWAGLKGTNPYEIICSFGGRVRRVYR